METPEEAAERRRHGSSFGPAAAEYDRYRPRYADAAIRWCLDLTNKDHPRVADVGAGTGILTGALRRLGAEVTAVEPDPRMLAELVHKVPGVQAGPGSAEELPLPDHSVDAVVAGQSLHWFDLDKALPEIARVLVPGGVLCGLWNVYDDNVSWIAELAELTGHIGPQTLTRWQSGFAASTHGSRLTSGTELFGPAETRLFENPRPQSAAELVATLSTHSYFLLMPEPERDAIFANVTSFLNARQETSDGEFTLPLVTAVVRTRLR